MPPTTHARSAVRGLLLVRACCGAFGIGLLAVLATSAMAQTYYVDNSVDTCSAASAGTEADPYCTIAQAMAAHKGPGITIIVKPGIYREQVAVPLAGAAGLPFVFQASGPGVVVDGSDDFTNIARWVPSLGTSHLAASVTWKPKQVYVDGARLALTTLASDLMPANSFRWVAGEGLYVNLAGDNPGAHQTLVGRRNHGFSIYSKSFVTIDGFQIAHTEDRGINIQNGCADLVISHNTVSFANSYGIQTVNGQRIVIDGNTVSDCNFHGIGLTAGASGCTVSNNESFRNAHPTIRQANGIYLFGASGNTLLTNRLHHNQDTGMYFGSGSNNCISSQNRSWSNGDHGFDHVASSGTQHVNDVAYGNLLDGFSFEGNSPGSSLFNCIATENGNSTAEYDLWVDASSSVGFSSDHNLFWNSAARPAIKYVSTLYSSLAAYQQGTGLDPHSIQADPLFADPSAGDFGVESGSPTIDAGHSGVEIGPVADSLGLAPFDDFRTTNRGCGPLAFADIGALEFVPVDVAPVATSPVLLKSNREELLTFTVSASDADGDSITSLVMAPGQQSTISGATFTPNATNTGGTFNWAPGTAIGNFVVRFIASNTLADTCTTRIQIVHPIRSEVPVEDQQGVALAPTLAFSDGFPNPSVEAVDFSLDLPEASSMDWSVYDMQGRLIRSDARSLPAGRHRLRWDGITASGRRAEPGMYFIRARVGGAQYLRRVVRF